jgi:nucleotide-binding universal stress UspA family protein
MSEASAKLRRILLPLDVSRDSLTALQVAFDLAKVLGAEISGLFIEDAQLVAAGNLPFAREVGSLSGIARRIGGVELEHRFRAVASKARAALAEAGERLNVQFSFQIGRGDVPAEILTAAAKADIVVLGKAGWSVGAFRKPGRTCLGVLSRSRIPVLIVEHGTTFSAPILAVTDGTPAGRRAVEFASDLSQTLGWDIAIFATEGISTSDDVLRKIGRQKHAWSCCRHHCP